MQRKNNSKYWDKALTITTGCTKVSTACDNCWAETLHNRFLRKANPKYNHDFSEVRVHPENINSIKGGKPKVYAVWNDLFHPAVDFNIVDALFCRMIGDPNTFLICTKRPERMAKYFSEYSPIKNALTNVFLGCTVENQIAADERIPELLKCKPFKLFLSVEPMLSAITLPWVVNEWGHVELNKLISCVIAGSESGHHKRETKKEWFMDLRDQCIEAGVPFFLKQPLELQGLSTIKKEDLWK